MTLSYFFDLINESPVSSPNKNPEQGKSNDKRRFDEEIQDADFEEID